MTCGRDGSGMVPEMWDKPLWWEGVSPYLDPWDSVRPRTASTHWIVPGKHGPHGELFFFLLKKEPMVLSELIEFGPCISAEAVKACALIGLHMMTAENALRSDGDTSLEIGDMWRYGGAKSLVWSSGGDDWAGCEGTSSFEDHEHNVDNLALEVVGQNWSSEAVSLLGGLGAWTGGIELPHGSGPFMPRNEGDVLGELKPLSPSSKWQKEEGT